MANKSVPIDEAMFDYILRAWVHEPDVMRRLREETAKMPNAGLQISQDEGQLLGVLTKLLGVRSYLEIGVFTGYSSLSVALNMPADGTVVACDISEEFTSVARRYWAEAGLGDRVDLRIGPGVESLDGLVAEGRRFDMAFIDADKPSYPDYYDRCMKLVRPGGAILVDNVLWHGGVGDPNDQEEGTVRMREFNAKLHADDRIDLCLIPVADGLTLARVR